jgi:hypothetical protein
MEKKLGIGFPWVNLEESRAAELLARLRKESPDVYDGWELTVARYLRPRFYANHALIEVRIARGDAIRVRYLLDGDDAMLPLEGRSDPIHAANGPKAWCSTPRVLDYLRFFVFFLRGSDGPFTLLEAELELLPSEGETVTPELEELRSHIRPLRIGGQDGQGRFLVPATVAYDGTMWRTTLAVSTGGEVEMIDEKDPVALGTARVPQCPYLDAPAAEAPVATEETAPVTAPPVEDATDEPTPVRPPRPQALEETVSDREITRAVVSVLLADAVRERVGNTLLKRFNSQTQADDPIAQLARFVSSPHPNIVIESDIPFVEDIVAGLLEPELGRKGKPAVDRAKAVSGDDSRCFLDLTGISAGDYFLISFHAYRSLWDAEWMAHELAIHSSTVLIGCTRQSEVPEALRRVADLGLTLPRIDRRLFARIFASVFGTPPPANWDRGGPDWTRYLIAADFHAPRRLKLTASQAVQYLRQRVGARLRQVSAVDAPALASLHGLGEARQVAEDLIADTVRPRPACPWVAIDRGSSDRP